MRTGIILLALLVSFSTSAAQKRIYPPALQPLGTTNFILEAGENQTIPGPVAIAQFVASLQVEGGSTNGVVTEWTYTDSPGVVAFATRTGLTNSGEFSVAGRYQINVRTYNGAYEVRDNFWVFVNEQGLTNFIPGVEMTGPPNGAQFTAPIDLLLTADASDKDGTITQVVFYNGPTILGTSTVAPYSFLLTNAGATNYTFAAGVTDDRGATNFSISHTVIVNPAPEELPTNMPPSIAITSPSSSTTWTNPIALAFSATASDPDGTVIAVTFSDNGVIAMVDTDPPYSVVIMPGVGPHELIATVTDDLGAMVSATNTITVIAPIVPNQTPTVNLTAPANGATYTAPATITVTATAADTDGTVSSVGFFSNGSSLGTDTTSPYSVTVSGVAAGSYTLSATATDNKGAVGHSTNRTVTVNPAPGIPPVITAISPTDGTMFLLGTTLLLSANATDADGTVTNVSWWSQPPNPAPDPEHTNVVVRTFIFGDTSGNPFTHNWTPAAGSYGVIGVALDNTGLAATTAVAVVSIRLPISPSVTLTQPTNGQVFTAGSTIPMAATITDPDNLATSVSFWQYQPDMLISTDSASPYTGNWAGVPAGNYSLVAKVAFGAGQVASSAAISITINPSPPVNIYVDAGPSKQAQLSVYKPYFDTEYSANAASFNALATSTGTSAGEDKYTLQYVMLGTRDMYLATLETNYINRALIWCEQMVNAAIITDSNGNKNWGGPWPSPYSATPIAYELYDIQGGSGMSSIFRHILTDPDLKAVYGSRATVVYNFVRDHIVNKSLVVRGNLPWYHNLLNNPATGSTDKGQLMGGMLLDLKLSSTALGNGDNTAKNYPALVTEFANGTKDWNGKTPPCFVQFCYSNNPALCGLCWQRGHVWQDWLVMDTSHAERIPDFVIDCYRAGQTFDISYVTGLANLFTRVIWDRSTSSPQFRNFIDGSNVAFLNRGPFNDGKIYAGWSMLSEFDQEALTTTQAMLRAIKNGVSNPSISYNNSSHGRSSLAGHLAKAISARVMPPYAQLDGIVTGSPISSILWTRTSGPGTATIVKPTSASTTILFNTAAVGIHQFKLTVTSGTNSISDSVSVTLASAPAF